EHLMRAVPGLAAVSHIHVWSLSSGRALATLHVRPKENAEARRIVRGVEHELGSRFGIGHATVAIDWNGEEEACSLTEAARPSGARTHSLAGSGSHSHAGSGQHDHGEEHRH